MDRGRSAWTKIADRYCKKRRGSSRVFFIGWISGSGQLLDGFENRHFLAKLIAHAATGNDFFLDRGVLRVRSGQGIDVVVGLADRGRRSVLLPSPRGPGA